MQSLSGVLAGGVVLAGILLAVVAGLVLGRGVSEILHLSLGIGAILLAVAVFDFRLPTAVKWPAAIAMAALGAIFLLQCAADLAESPALTNLAYRALGLWPERLLALVFMAWCLAVQVWDSRGLLRPFGLAALAVAVGIEVYSDLLFHSGAAFDGRLKLFDVPLFLWLVLESWRPTPLRT